MDEENGEEEAEENAPPEKPGRVFKSAYYILKDEEFVDDEIILKPIMSLLIETLFLYERIKPEKRSKEFNS